MLILSPHVDQKSLETEFSIAICCLTGDKWQSKTLFLAILDQYSSIVKRVFICCLSGVIISSLINPLKAFRIHHLLPPMSMPDSSRPELHWLLEQSKLDFHWLSNSRIHCGAKR